MSAIESTVRKQNRLFGQSKSGAWLVRYALEELGVRFTFGIPGVHNTEIYDELNKSEKIEPVLVTHEGGGSFMADAISRTSDSIGTCLIVPAAGVTHAASGIAEASLDGIPMLVISGGIRNDTGHAYQLHDMDQHALLKPITKATFKVASQAQIVDTLFRAYLNATEGEPGPVFVEIPTNISLFKGPIDALPSFQEFCDANNNQPTQEASQEAIEAAAKALASAKQVGLFVGWGAADASETCVELAEWLDAPACTTLQGLSAFPANHPLHVGMGFGAYAVPAAEEAFKDVDCLLAIGTRFSEIPTGSFSMPVPEKLIHLDINPEVFNQNFKAEHALSGDAKIVVPKLLAALKKQQPAAINGEKKSLISHHKNAYLQSWLDHDSQGRVNPARLMTALRDSLNDDAYVVADDGNHTFLTAELMPIHESRHFICPSDFNCMGYCVPAAIACKLANPEQQVVGIVGDGAFMMTAMELVTATTQGLGLVYLVFNDGELSQISQAQQIPYNRKTCTVLGGLNIEGVAMATGAHYLKMENDDQIEAILKEAHEKADENRTVLVDVHIDYSKATRFTQGVVAANLKRFSLKDKARFIGRALKRKVTG